MRYHVTGRGGLDSTLPGTGIDVRSGEPVGGTVGEGEPLPEEPRRYHFYLDSDSEENAIGRVRVAVKAAGGICGRYEAELVPED
jgi:hypothetical protein